MGRLLDSLSDWTDVLKHRTEVPCKVTRFELESALAERQPLMTPDTALAYASWLTADERGWHAEHGDPHSVASQGSLAPAFGFLDPARTSSEARPSSVAADTVRTSERTDTVPALQVNRLRHAAQTGEAEISNATPLTFAFTNRAPHPASTAVPARIAARLRSGARNSTEADRADALEEMLALVLADGGGEPLPAEALAAAQGELGEVASEVRVHTSALAGEAARLLGASAFTIGRHIYFATGELAPGTPEGDRLLRHELTHVRQHERGELAAGPRPDLLAESSAAEAEARAAETTEWAAVRAPRRGRRPGEEPRANALREVLSARMREQGVSKREPRDGQLPIATLERMEQAYGQHFGDVEIHADSAEVPAGQQAFTRGRHIYFEHGAFEPESDHGEHVIAHELAHVAQQSQPASEMQRPASRAALEDDAHQATLAALAGGVATVNLAASPSTALGFSNGHTQRPPAPASGQVGRPPAQSARGSAPAPSAGAAPTGAATRVPTNARSGGTGARPGTTPAARLATPPAAASAPPPAAATALLPTAAAPARGANPDGLLVPEAPSALTPDAAGRLQTIRADNQDVATATTTLPTAEQQTDVARAAVVEPQAEQDAHAQHDVVAAVDDRPPPSPEIEAACARIRQVIRDKRPPDEDKLVDAKPREMAQQAGEQMSAGVEERAGTVRQGYAGMQQPPQGTPSTTPVPATLPPDRVQTQPVAAATGTPDPLQHDDVSLDGDVAAQQQRIQDAGMNTEAGQLVQDGPIGDARGGVSDLQTMARTDPQKVLADQAAAITHAQDDMRALQAAAEKALADARAGTVAQIGQHTTGVKGSEEQQRAQAGAQMQAIFTRTQQSVDTLLQPLSGNAVARWEAGVAQLSTEFEASLASVKQKIEDRHSGVGGFVTEIGDDLFGLPGWVVLAYDLAEAKFSDGATSLITDISRDVNLVIEDCKKLIDQARKDIETIVHGLPASLQSWAQGEADKLGRQLDQLSQRVDQTQHGLNQDLINRANGAVQTVRERVADLREQAKGLLGKIADAIGEFIKNPAKAIINGLLHILGIPPASFWALIDKLGDVISGIAAEPMKFANTLMAGVGQGFQQFFHNLPTHLGQALFQWLFSKLGEAGVAMPADFSMRSILTLVLEVMGITWTRIKTILARHIGAENAELLDQAVKLVQVLIDKGPQGVFEMIADQLDPSMIIDAIKDAAIQYVMEAIITRVTARILMMLNPAGAILQAIEAIYRVIKWVVDNAARIFTLIESIVNGAAQILAGNTSGVANLVENSLVRLMVPVIEFLADYLGLGGIPNAIKNVILGLQSKVEKILDRVIGFVVTKAKALWEAVKSQFKGKGKDEDKDKDKGEKTEAQQTAHAAAEQAWQQAESATTSKLLTEPEVEAILANAAKAGEGSTITVELVKTGTSWAVRARAQVHDAHGEAKVGHGWIATEPGGRPWFAATDLSSFNRQVIDDAYRVLVGPGPQGQGETDEAQYHAKTEQARSLETEGQSKLDSKTEGLKLTIKMEPLVIAKQHHGIKTHFEVSPNVTQRDGEVPLADEPVGEFKIERPNFTRTLKRNFRDEYPTAHSRESTRILDGLDRRHIISSDEMAKHYQSKLAPMKVSDAAKLLSDRSSPVSDPPTREKVIKVAQKRHKEFFNELSNLWPGDSSPNRSIGAGRDRPGSGEPYVPEMTDAEYERHEQEIYKKWGLE